jgi:hypothetical protein
MGLYKFLKLKDDKIGSHDAKLLVGQKSNGDPYERKFFANNKDLLRQLKDVGTGDWIEIIFDDTKFKNIKEIKPGKAPEVEDAPQSSEKKFIQKGYSNVRRSDGTSRGDDTNRSAALYFVKDLVTQWFDGLPAADKKKVSVQDMAHLAIQESKTVFDYISKGTCPGLSVEEDDEDPLDPPSIDD